MFDLHLFYERARNPKYNLLGTYSLLCLKYTNITILFNSKNKSCSRYSTNYIFIKCIYKTENFLQVCKLFQASILMVGICYFIIFSFILVKTLNL